MAGATDEMTTRDQDLGMVGSGDAGGDVAEEAMLAWGRSEMRGAGGDGGYTRYALGDRNPNMRATGAEAVDATVAGWAHCIRGLRPDFCSSR
jgi:hypothetical protein